MVSLTKFWEVKQDETDIVFITYAVDIGFEFSCHMQISDFLFEYYIITVPAFSL